MESLRHAEYIDGPTYTRSPSSRAGGMRAQATLGPLGYSGRGTDADSSLPPAINDARRTYPAETFIAGHLLNADFGGIGTESRNLTILTSRANSRMKSFDNPIKTAMGYVRRVYETLSRMYLPIDHLRYGIEIDVRTSGPDYTWSTHSPGKYISSYILCSAKIHGKSKIYDWYNNQQGSGSDRDWESVFDDLANVEAYVNLTNGSDLIDNEPAHGT